MFLQRIWVQFLVSTWQLATVSNSNSRGSNNLFWALENVNDTYIDASKMLIKDLKVHFENE